MSCYYLVLLETSGNQSYIFSTNRLRENIGASQLTYQAGIHWVIEAVGIQNKEVLSKDWRDPEKLRDMLRHNNPALENSNRNAEIIIAASGKALVLTKDKETAQAIISHVTKKALIEAPGLDISGVYEKIENWEKENSLAKLANAIRQVHKTFEKARSRRPSPENRFLRLPIIADCAVSGLPASKMDYLGKKPKPISQVSAAKCDPNVIEDAQKRLTAIDRRLQKQVDQLLRDEESEEEKRSWLAVVHADGNGLGQIFLNFQDYIGEDKSNRNYIKQYRHFSLALDECTEAAFKEALNIFPEEQNQKMKKIIPIVPLIIGGDDLTVVCDGEYALEFTKTFLEQFEKETSKKTEISEIAQEVFATNRLSACAGVAIVKRHFPFSVAYHLAEQLIKSAKEVKKKVTCIPTDKIPKNTPFPCSAIDFHILYDSSNVELSEIRDQLKPLNEKYTKLYNRPYIVTLPDADKIQSKISPDNEDIGIAWVESRKWKVLAQWVKLIKHDPILLPSSQANAIRTTLFLGKQQAEAQYQLIQSRYPELQEFLKNEHKESLFREENSKDKNDEVKTYQITSFIDALDAKDFLKKLGTNNSSPSANTELDKNEKSR